MNMKKYVVFAENNKTDEFITLGTFDSQEEADWNIENNLEWDEDDIIEDWHIFTEEVDEDDDDHFYEPDECGFDPYMGCYTYDC
jgi:hypothetical protein